MNAPTTDDGALDVRELPPQQKHPTIFEWFDELEPGQSFELVNDHDPVPLKYQFQAERGDDAFEWRYHQQGPEVWRVELTRTGA